MNANFAVAQADAQPVRPAAEFQSFGRHQRRLDRGAQIMLAAVSISILSSLDTLLATAFVDGATGRRSKSESAFDGRRTRQCPDGHVRNVARFGQHIEDACRVEGRHGQRDSALATLTNVAMLFVARQRATDTMLADMEA